MRNPSKAAGILAFDADRRPSLRRSPHEQQDEQRPDDDARTAEAQQNEKVEHHARQHGHHPCEQRPHREKHEARPVIAQQHAAESDRHGQQIGRRSPCDEGDAATAPAEPHPATNVEPVDDDGRNGKQEDQQQQHDII